MASAKATASKPSKPAAPAKKVTAPARKTAAVKKAAPARKAAATKKAAPKKAAPVKKAAAAKKAAQGKKTAAPKKAAPVKKAAAANKAAPAKKTVTPKKTAVAKKAIAPKKTVARKAAAPAKKAVAKKAAAKKTVAKKAAPAKVAAKKTAKPRTRKVVDAPTVTVQNVAAAVTIEPAAPAGTRWRGRPIVGNAVRAVAVSVPLASSIISGVVLSHVIHRPHSGLAVLAWWLGIMVASTLVLVAVDRVARRMLPLATLLKLAMAFPDQAPSRFKVAARAGTTRSLEQQLRRAEEVGIDDGPAQAARRILTLVGALGAHDRRTRGHSERVRAFNDLIAQEMRLPQHDRDRLRWAALLHDIGKLHVPTRILNKPKKPTEKEWAILKSHPARGARIAAPLSGWLGEWAPTIEQHHERWDGAGYPHGLSGNDICLGARIVAVADAYEVMTAPRPYSRPVSAAAAREELARCADAQFDPEVVRAFLNISIGKLRKVIGPISWLAQLPLIGATPRLEAAVGMAGRQAVSVAATATGTGVLAAAMLPHAAHHHHHHVDHLTATTAAGSYSSPTHRSHAAPAVAKPPAPHHAVKATPGHRPTATTHSVTHNTPSATGQTDVPTATPTGSDTSGTTTGTAPDTSTGYQPTALPPANRPTQAHPVKAPTTAPTAPSTGPQQPPAPAPAPEETSAAPTPTQSSKPPKDAPAPKPVETKAPNDDAAKKAQEAADKAAKQAAEDAKKAQEAADKAAQQAAEQAKHQDPHPEHGGDPGHGH